MKKSGILWPLVLLTALLASCEAAPPQTPVTESAPPETGPVYSDSLGERDFGGREFNLYLANVGYGSLIDFPEMTGDVFEDAVYSVTKSVEDRFNTDVVYTYSFSNDGGGQTEATKYMSSLILSGDTTYSIFLHALRADMMAMVYEGSFVDWNGVPNVELERDWWYLSAARSVNYGDKLYTMMSPANLRSVYNTECVMFNKALFTSLSLELPYKSVHDGSWTNEVFLADIAAGTADLNGDGVLDYDNDRYGYAGWQYEQVPALYVGFGGGLVSKDADNNPVLGILTKRNEQVINAIAQIFKDPGAFYQGKTFGMEDEMFKESRLLFNDAFIGQLNEYRDMEDDYGFVPYPKLDESQDDYRTRVGSGAGMFYIPVTTVGEMLDMTGVVMEALSCQAYERSIPTFFDIVLTAKASRDTESEKMIPIICKNGVMLDVTIPFDVLKAVNSGSFASYYSSIQNQAEAQIKTITEAYGKK